MWDVVDSRSASNASETFESFTLKWCTVRYGAVFAFSEVLNLN